MVWLHPVLQLVWGLANTITLVKECLCNDLIIGGTGEPSDLLDIMCAQADVGWVVKF